MCSHRPALGFYFITIGELNHIVETVRQEVIPIRASNE